MARNRSIWRNKENLLKRYVKLENGIPSHDTFQRVFEHLDPKAFNRAFMDWTNKLCDNTEGRIIALDGKTLRGSTDGNKKAIHIVNPELFISFLYRCGTPHNITIIAI